MRAPRTAASAALVVLAIAACAKEPPPPSGDEPTAVAVTADSVETRTFQDVLTVPGEWRSAGNVDLTAPFAGAVDSLTVRPGDRVKRGQVLAYVVSEEARAEIRGATLLAETARDAAGSETAKRALDLARKDLLRVPLPSPESGTIADLGVGAGGEVAADQRILTIVPDGAVVFEAHVNPSDAHRVSPGQEGQVLEPGLPPRDVVVDRVLPVADAADQATLAWLRSGKGDPPPIGRAGTAVLTVGAPHVGAAVPLAAIVEDDLTGQARIAVVTSGDRAMWTPVKLGAQDAGWREIASPVLPPGTLVITAGQRGLPDSATVQVTP